MITSNYINKILEAYQGRVKAFGGSTEVFVNPTRTEIQSAYKESLGSGRNEGGLRFLADNKSKKVYVWNAYVATHDNVAMMISIDLASRYELKDNSVLPGDATVKSGKAVMILTYRELNHPNSFYSVPLVDWSWVNPFVDCSEYVRKEKENYQRILKK